LALADGARIAEDFTFANVKAVSRRWSMIVRDIWREFGVFHFERRDMNVPVEAGQKLV
jgi:hypothetical protein